MFFFLLVPYVDLSYMGRERQLVMFLKGLHTVLHKGECRCRRRWGVKCVACFLCVLGSLVSIVYFIWHEPFLFNLLDLARYMLGENILWTAFTSNAPPLKIVVLLFILKGPQCHKASCLWEWTLMKRKIKASALIRDVHVDQTPMCSTSSLVPKNKSGCFIILHKNKLIRHKNQKISMPKVWNVLPWLFLFKLIMLFWGTQIPVVQIHGDPMIIFMNSGSYLPINRDPLSFCCVNPWQR